MSDLGLNPSSATKSCVIPGQVSSLSCISVTYKFLRESLGDLREAWGCGPRWSPSAVAVAWKHPDFFGALTH